jgi:hypothetical protein
MLPRLMGTLLLLALTGSAGAQSVESGPEKGMNVAKLKVFDATGAHKDKEVDYAADRKGKGTVYVFIEADKWDRPMARFLKELDKALQKDGEDVLVIAVWLTGDADKTKDYLPRAQQSLQLQSVVLTCFPGDKAGPEGWNINQDAHLTAVVANKGQVAASFGYRSINETDVPTVHKALQKARAEK